MNYRYCPNCHKRKVTPVAIEVHGHFVDHLVQCPACEWYGCQTEFLEEADINKLTEDQKEMVRLLNSKVTFLPASWDKRFARGISSLDYLTDKQLAALEKMFHRYRRQIPNHAPLCPICQKAGYQMELFNEG